MSRVICAFLAALLLIAPARALAQSDWPSKPVRIIVPAPAGGAYDRVMRPLAKEMSTILKQPIIVDNRPSAGNIVGLQAATQAAPDGYTLTMTGMINSIGAGLYEKLPYDFVTDFTHVGGIGGGTQWLYVRADAGITSLADLLARAKAEPGKFNYGSSGSGSSAHLMMEQLQRATGAVFTHIPYKGGAPALADTLGGTIPLAAIPSMGVAGHVSAGKLIPLAVSSTERTQPHPNVPTLAELGYPQASITSWVGLSAPKGTPADVVKKVNAALNEALSKPDIVDPLIAEGTIIMRMTPEAYADLVKTDTARWSSLVRSLGLKAE